jgi:hypothetical protein
MRVGGDGPGGADTLVAGWGDRPAARPCLDHRVGSEGAGVCAQPCLPLVCVDGLASYVTAFLRVFRDPVRTGRRGRPWSRVCSSYIMCREHIQWPTAIKRLDPA